jgi:CheY-like chemotaxis protein
MRKPRAIVRDDDGVILNVFKHMLEAAGYEVLTADTCDLLFFQGTQRQLPAA